MAEGNVLQVIVFSILLGTSIMLAGEKGKEMARFFNSFAEVMFKFVQIVIQIAPYGVFCLIAPTTGLYGLEVLLPLISVVLYLLAAVIIHVSLVYLPILKIIGRYSVTKFLKNSSEALLMAFSSALSSAAYPFSMKSQENMGVSKRVRSFVMTVNMDGTSLYLAISAVFIANVYGIHLSGIELALIVLTGVLASIGATAVPMAGLIMLTLVLTSVGLPKEGLALVAGIDRILDMLRTFTNVLGDNIGSVTVAATEKEMIHEKKQDHRYETAQ
ncbi:sodium:dicarboxylate symporter family protein [Melghirimyces profundicolus]|uniref:Sodium:dicarboxylate symporter family protein n=2 Tax=Melghirimyces profundicolus TaxID=1242148 RepID=A0A2T6BYZ3_9BACL|nr:sodium:dicarboxylate symporter family protein [Melghirimyces profundicolus]